MLVFVYALVITAGLGALFASGFLVRYACIRSKRPKWTSIAIGVYAFAALAGAIKFCYDLVAHRNFWSDDSTAIAILNFVGILMINSYTLLLTVVGCASIYLSSKSGVKQATDAKSVEP